MPPDIRCDSCRHWGQRRDRSAFRDCVAIPLDVQRFTQETVPPGEARDEFRARHPAAIEDFDGMYGSLRTRADFGCTLFEGRT